MASKNKQGGRLVDKSLIIKLHKNFEDYMHTDENGIEFWYARELQELLEYSQWRNFEQVIDKAKIACENSSQQVKDHFADVSKMVEIGSGATKNKADYKSKRFC